MRFARHETFPFREGWISKAFRQINEGNAEVFSQSDAIEQLGIGSNMVKSLRYWMQALGLTEERKGRKGQQLTSSLGETIFQYDRYLEMESSLWLLHYHLVSNCDWATTWYWFFNFFQYTEFDEKMFTEELAGWIAQQGTEVASGSLKRDYDCLMSMYVRNDAKCLEPEDNLSCPLQELGLIEVLDSKHKIYHFTRRNLSAIEDEILFYMILHFIEKHQLGGRVSIEQLCTMPGGLGRVLAVGYGDIITILERLQQQDRLRIVRTAGLNQVVVNSITPAAVFLENFYEKQYKVELANE